MKIVSLSRQSVVRILVATDNHLVCFRAISLLQDCMSQAALDYHFACFEPQTIAFYQTRSPILQGVWEKDEIRKNDSFRTFKEIFELANDQKVDMVLLGGDLFHDNKPSRSTLVRAVEILTEHCLRNVPINFDIVSNEKENFATGCVHKLSIISSSCPEIVCRPHEHGWLACDGLHAPSRD